MKFVFETLESWKEPKEVFGEVAMKMYAIQDNVKFITDTLKEQFPNDDIVKEAEQHKLVLYTCFNQITVDFSNALDEFYLENSCDEEGAYSGSIPLEVVTKEVAEGNDKDWLRGDTMYSDEEKKTYKVGEVLSDYTKLGDTEYYFKFL